MLHRNVHSGRHRAHLHRQASLIRRTTTTTGTLTSDQNPSILKRAATTCGADHTSSCTTQGQEQSQGTLTIALAAAIPIVVALVVLFFLHRRIKKKMKHEDANDKHKSLDFGLDVVPGGPSKKGKKGKPEMTINTGPNSSRRNRGLSMDIDLHNPYLLPAGVNGSRDSLHSLSRSQYDSNDPYRPVTFANSDTESLRSANRMRNGSINTAGGYSERSASLYKAPLVQNAARMPQGSPPEKLDRFDAAPRNVPKPPPRAQSRVKGNPDRWYPADDPKYGSNSPPDLMDAQPQTPQDMLSEKPAPPSFPQPNRHGQHSPPASYDEKRSFLDSTSPMYPPGDALRITVPTPTHDRQNPTRTPNPLPLPPVEHDREPYHERQQQQQQQHQPPQLQRRDFDLPPPPPPPPAPKHDSDPHHQQLNLPGQENRRVSVMGMRPLPPDDLSEDPEMRANRIRSFYREYFDDSKPNPPGHYPPMPVHDPHAYGPGEDEYYSDFVEDGAYFDPETGAYYSSPVQQPPYAPFAEPLGRRAMTPPPRAPPQFMRGHRSVMSTQSAGRRPMPKRQLPPPKALATVPTPAMIRDDSSLLDFAPRTTFRDRQLGRAPDSPLGSTRPYSPAFRAATPLAHSFDDLAAMPSPHALRKSSTFTGLDFAPPPRFRDRADTMSDAGSIRSNRSGISAVQQNAIRSGAYRVSRLPTDQVGTHLDMANSLKPKWDAGR